MKKFREIFEFIAFGEEEGVRRVRVRIRNIISLGFINKKAYTKEGTFKNFEKIGYILNKEESTIYTTSKYTVRDFLNFYKGYTAITSKEVITETRNGKEVKAIDWHYCFKDLPEPAKKPVNLNDKRRKIDK
jgi:hypothetical protein